MNAKRISVTLIVVVLLGVSTALASLSVGPYPGTSPDSGTCGNNWATDTFQRLFTDVGHSGFTEQFNNGTFVTLAGRSPDACNGHPFNGNTVAAGLSGSMHGVFDVTVTGATRFTPGACTPALCSTTAGFVSTVYGSAVYVTGATYFVFDYTTCDGLQSWRNASANRGGNAGDIVGGPVACPQAGAVTWFAPGDGRIDPRPGDRLAVWCNAASNPQDVVVYGIADNQPDWNKGFYLASFANADLLKAGHGGITKALGPNGTVSMMTDGKGEFYVAWNGGQYGANGHGDFAKSFTCDFAQ